MAKNKTTQTDVNVEDYLNSIEHEQKRKDGFRVMEMMKKVSGFEPKVWGPTIIGYGFYTHTYESGHSYDGAFLAFAPRKQHLVLYVLNNFKGQDKLLQKLGKYKTGKVCLYINKLDDVDWDVLKEITQKAFQHSFKTYGP